MKNKKNWIGAGLLLVIAALTVTLVALHAKSNPPQPLPTATPRPTPRVVVEEKVVETIVEVEHQVTAEELSAGLNDMGRLITAEYYFTAVASASTQLAPILGIKLGFTESSFLASYDGVVEAGIDCSKITVEKDEEARTILVSLPKAEARPANIDPNSLVVYSEKEGTGNHISITDYNKSLIELENAAEQKAIDRGLLEKADANAQTLIRSFVGGLVDLTEYQLTIRQLP